MKTAMTKEERNAECGTNLITLCVACHYCYIAGRKL